MALSVRFGVLVGPLWCGRTRALALPLMPQRALPLRDVVLRGLASAHAIILIVNVKLDVTNMILIVLDAAMLY